MHSDRMMARKDRIRQARVPDHPIGPVLDQIAAINEIDRLADIDPRRPWRDIGRSACSPHSITYTRSSFACAAAGPTSSGSASKSASATDSQCLHVAERPRWPGGLLGVHSITSSARKRIDEGTVTSAFAALRLTASSSETNGFVSSIVMKNFCLSGGRAIAPPYL